MNKQIIANNTVRDLIKIGTLKYSGCCYLCGLNKKTVFHHPDYDKPDMVVELCHSCHGHIHYGNVLFLEYANILPLRTRFKRLKRYKMQAYYSERLGKFFISNNQEIAD